MRALKHVAFIGNHLPRRCGIATFTHDLHRAVATAAPGVETCVVAMTDSRGAYDYPHFVQFEVRDTVLTDYHKTASDLNEAGVDVVSLQHEFGIFGGDAGANILELLTRLNMPIVTTLHTILADPSPAQRSVLDQIIALSAKVVVMSEKGGHFLRTVHGAPAEKIDVIPHGIPECPFIEPEKGKARFGFSGKSVILTFGLLSPSKGIETVIDAMPAITEACPNAVYVVLGATHPNLVRDQGETYREGLISRARQLGVADHVVFCNQFVDQATLLEYISICDVYVTPYLNEAQMTSGTLAYSFGLGKAVVSTPYWHAQELLAEGRGILVPFADAVTTGAEISALLTNDVRRNAMRKLAYKASRPMTWPQTAQSYLSHFKAIVDQPRSRRLTALTKTKAFGRHHPLVVPKLKTDSLLAMCDSTGLLQHAVHSVPDRSHGYCVDDNARALLLACRLGSDDGPRLPETLTTRFAAFIQHAWNPDTRRFRNFMSYDRRWLEPMGSEDSHCRTLWALGICSATDVDSSRRDWANRLFRTALTSAEQFSSPRAWAFALLGLNGFCQAERECSEANESRALFADRLVALLNKYRSSSWNWFEPCLAYDNARLPQALIETGLATGTEVYIDAGLDSLRWLMVKQTSPTGCFRPIGTASFGITHAAPAQFDQQPVDAAATIEACRVAARADCSPEWPDGAALAFNWFLGANDLGLPLVDPKTGRCFDGLHATRPNQNIGAESVLSYLLALNDIGQFRRAIITPRQSTLVPSLALSA